MHLQPEFRAVGIVAEDVYESQQEANIASGVRRVEIAAVHDTPLAVVGGGPSIKQQIDELANWPGDIWAINQTAQWLMKYTPKCPVYMFSVDPDPRIASFADGVDRAILGGSCHPDLFAKFQGKDVRYFLTRPIKGTEKHIEPRPELKPKVETFGPSSVTRTFMPAAMLGYKDITYFGCEGCLDEDTLNANACRNDYALGWRSHDNLRLMIIKAGGKEYLTTPDYYMTTQSLANVIKAYPKLKEKSGGLLRAMLNDPEWSCVAVSEALRNDIFTDATERYETPFSVPAESFA